MQNVLYGSSGRCHGNACRINEVLVLVLIEENYGCFKSHLLCFMTFFFNIIHNLFALFSDLICFAICMSHIDNVHGSFSSINIIFCIVHFDYKFLHVMSLKVASNRFFFHFREVSEKCREYIGKFISGKLWNVLQKVIKFGKIFDKGLGDLRPDFGLMCW